MNPLVESMNDIFNQWKQQHDLFNNIHSIFKVKDGAIYFDDLPLCVLSDLKLSSADYDTERIQFIFNQNRSILIDIVWPEDLPPKIVAVSFVHFIP